MKSRIVILLVVLAVFSIGCKNVAEKAVEKAIEKESGGKARVDTDKGTVEVETDKGKVQIGNNSELPEGFPEDIPIYENAKITSSVNAAGTFSLTLNAEGKKVDEIADFYKEELEKEDWKSEMSTNSDSGGQSIVGLQYKKGKRQVTISITGAEGGTIIAIQTSEK